MKKVYIVEDEENLQLLLQKYLENSNYIVKTFSTGEDAIKCINENPDLWLLDIMLPGIDGYEVFTEIKKQNPLTPIVFMSAKNEDIDRLKGLELGSDDYIPKPFLPKEVVLRVNKILNKVGQESPQKVIKVGEYLISPTEKTVTKNEEEIKLSANEFDLLLYFVTNKNKTISRTQILSEVWKYDYFSSDRIVDDTIRRLRKKMPDVDLQTLYGTGYKLVAK